MVLTQVSVDLKLIGEKRVEAKKTYEPDSLEVLEKLILSKRKKLFTKPTTDEGLVLIISGGIDSTTALFRVAREFDCTIYPLYVKRGARAEKKELESITYHVERFQKFNHKIQNLEILEADLPPSQYKTHIPAEQLVTTGHTLRNSMLQSYGVQYAMHVGFRDNLTVRTVFISSSPDDGFPHGKLASLRAQTVMTCLDLADWSWQTTSPLLENDLWGSIDKPTSIRYAIENGLSLDRTYTCISNGEMACGICDACEARLLAFSRSGYKDPIEYKVYNKS